MGKGTRLKKLKEKEELESDIELFISNPLRPPLNGKYNMYFDESGEKKFTLKKDGNYTIKKFNENDDNGFGFYILGGIASTKEINCFESIDSEVELKSMNLNGDFFSVFKEENVRKIIKKFTPDVYIHFDITDIYLFIIEELIFDISSTFIYSQKNYEIIKSIVMKFMKNNTFRIKEIIHAKTASDLVIDFQQWLSSYEPQKEECEFVKAFLTVNIQDIEISNNFIWEYMNTTISRVCDFYECNIIFDNEQNLEKKLSLTDKLNVEFMDSVNEINIQISDMVIGLVRRLFEYLKINSLEDFENDYCKLTSEEQLSMRDFLNILKYSIEEVDVFVSTFIDFETRRKYELLLDKYKI